MKLSDYQLLAKQIFNEHNKVRENPKCYIPLLEETLSFYKDNIFSRPGEDSIQTVEGKEAVEEAIAFLYKKEPVPALTIDQKLTRACKDHIEDIGPKGMTTHESSYLDPVTKSALNVSDRIEKYAEWDIICCENIDFGNKNAKDVIITMIIDDGLKDRPHRRNLFHPDIRYMGVAVGAHRDWELISVINYVGNVRNIGDESPYMKTYINDIYKKAEERKNNPKPLNAFQEDDFDAPDNTTGKTVIKTTKKVKGKTKKITKNIYSLTDGTQHVVEIEDAAEK